MAVNLPVPGEEPWDEKLNAAITEIDSDLQSAKATFGSQVSTVDADLQSAKGEVAAVDADLQATKGQVAAVDSDLQATKTSLDSRLDVLEAVPGDGGEESPPVSRFVPVVIFNGETNSGGFADNVSATAPELAPRPAVQIFDNIGLASYSPLDIGTNNLLDHSGLTGNYTHGWELGLANSVEAGEWWDDTLYLIKTGQGGSRVSDWGPTSSFYTKFLERTRNGLALLRSQGKVPIIYFWYSLGINDAITGTNEATWLSDVKLYHDRVRDELGYVPIIMTKLPATSEGVNYNDSIVQYGLDDNMVIPVEETGATMKDVDHWDYEGMKLMAARLCAASKAFGQHENYLLKQNAMLAGGNVLTIPADSPSLVRTPASVSFIEGSVGGSFTVKLDKAPAANVVITVAASGGNVFVDKPSLTFTSANYGTTQTVVVTSPDDGTNAGNRSSTITLSSLGVASSATVAVTVTDAFVAAGPVNTVLPAITGTPATGSTLTCSTGTWTGSPTGYTYQWKRDGSDIAGQTASTHTVVAADQGHTLSCVVTATNPTGSTPATSAGTAVPAAPTAPVNTALPAITGTTTLASTLTCSTGTWTNSPTGYTYQWKRDGVVISGATADTRVIAAADIGTTLSCTVTATNVGGSTAATAAGLLVPNPNRQLFVMMGQSNMVGRGTDPTTVVVAPGKGYVYNHQTGAITSGIVEPVQGANAGATSSNVSAVPSLVKTYTNQINAIPVVNKSCKGNMYIQEMDAGATMYTTTVESTNAAKAAIDAQGNVVTDVWGFWLQGESDAVGGMSETQYKAKLTDMFERLKVDCGITKLFIIRVSFNRINTALDVPTYNIQRAQKKLSIERSDVIMLANINSEFQMTTVAPFTKPTMSATDGIHYTSYGYEVVGAEAGNSLAYFATTGQKPPLEENVPELDVEEQPATMVENRYDFTRALTDEVGGKDFTVVGTGYTLDSTGLRIPSASATSTTISLAQSLVLDNLKDWAVEFEVTLDAVASITSTVGTVIGNRSGGIKDAIWFGIGGTNQFAIVDSAGVVEPDFTIAIPTVSTRYKFVYVASTGQMHLVVNDVLSPTSVPHSGNLALRYLFTGYLDNITSYIFKGVIKNLAVRYDVNYKVELPAIEPTVLADFDFNETGIVNNNPTANNLVIVPGREAGHTFATDGINLLGGTRSGFTFANSILLNLTAKWVVTFRASWVEHVNDAPNGFSSSDGMLLADTTSYDWNWNGAYKITANGSVLITKGKPFWTAKHTYTITNDPALASPMKILIDGVMEWQGTGTLAWSIKRFGAGYNTMLKGWPGKVEYVYLAVNTTELPSRPVLLDAATRSAIEQILEGS